MPLPQYPLPVWHLDPLPPVEAKLRQMKRRRVFIVLLVLAALGLLIYWRYVAEVPRDFSKIDDHFKYGSIGSEYGNGLPFRIWQVLPEMFPEYLPKNGLTGYESLGFVVEKDKDGRPLFETPIGFSRRRIAAQIELISVNCASCHASTYRGVPTEPRQVMLASPAHRVDLLAYFGFLIRCAEDPRFTADNLMARIEAKGGLDPIERIAYRSIAIPRTREQLLLMSGKSKRLFENPSGVGRIDTFTPYKLIQFSYRDPELLRPGNTDLPSIWNQAPRVGMQLHWDGNNTSIHERNISAGIGAGASPTSIDLPRLKRIEDWLLTLPPPKWPSGWKFDQALADRGKPLYLRYCAECHGTPEGGFKGGKVGTVVPLALIKTDPERLMSYTYDFMSNQYSLGTDQDWRFHTFRKTDGYANQPLDGIWARGPYLHNGSVPTLRDLLEPSDLRPKMFYKGNDVVEQTRVGFVSDKDRQGDEIFQKYETSKIGNKNVGHEGPAYGTDLKAPEKDALVEYLKTF